MDDDRPSQITLLKRRIAELETALRVAADVLEKHYGALPRDKHPGPPDTIITAMRAVLKNS